MGQKSMIDLRPAGPADVKTLFEWRNDPVTRENFINSNVVPWDEHVKWFNKSLGMKHRKIFIGEDRGRPIGTIMLDYNDNGTAELSWNVAPVHRGCRYGTEMLRQVCRMESQRLLVAKIKPTNIASSHMAMHCGFWCNVEEDGLLIWTRLGKQVDETPF